MKTYQALAKALATQAKTPLFGVVGDSNAYLVDDFAHKEGGDYIAASAEAGAVLMAIGAAMVSGEVGFATVTHGPALTNCSTPLAEGVKSNTPLVLLCGDTPEYDRENLQNINQRDIILATGAGFEQMRSPKTALVDLARAVRRAKAERRPIGFNMPTEMLWEPCEMRAVSWDVPTMPATEIMPEQLDEAIGMIAAARRPVILAGRGAIDDEARAALTSLANRLEAPLATTMRANGLFADQDYNLGVFGTVSSPAASDAIMTADCIIAFGASLNFHTTAGGSFVDGKRVIQIADRAEDLGRNEVADVAILGQMAATAETIEHWLNEAEIPASGFTRDLTPGGLAKFDLGTPKQTRPGTVDFLSTVARLNEELPQERTLITDAGRWMVRSYGILTAAHPRDWVTTASFGSIGLGMGAAIGATAARKDRTGLLFCGDGGFMLGNLVEFHTAVREKLDLIVVIFNDGGYGAERIQLVEKQMDPAIAMFEWPDFVSVAESLGGAGMAIHEASDFDGLGARLEARDRTKPFLLDVHLDPDHVAMW